MNNKERLIWLLAAILGGFLYNTQSNKLNGFEIMEAQYRLNSSIKSDQILDLMYEVSNARDGHYQQGFEDGKSHAMISAVKGEHLYGYSDGYHAALSQFDTNQKLGNKDNEIHKLFMNALDQISDLEDGYNDLLDSVGSVKDGN
jgi:hypothetical protein